MSEAVPLLTEAGQVRWNRDLLCVHVSLLLCLTDGSAQTTRKDKSRWSWEGGRKTKWMKNTQQVLCSSNHAIFNNHLEENVETCSNLQNHALTAVLPNS